MKLEFTLTALHDLERIQQFIFPHNPIAALRANARIRESIRMIMDTPLAGRMVQGNVALRELLIDFGSAGYVLRYRVKPGRITVLRIWHQKERRRK